MVKKILSVVVAFLMLFCTIPLSVFADDVLSVCPKCGERTYVQKTGLTVDACGIGVTYNSKHCNSCRYSYYDWVLFGVAGYKEFDSGSGDSLPADFISEWIVKNFGKGAQFSQFQAGGGSASPGGVGRNPAGYAGEGTPSYNVDGDLFVLAQPIFFARGDNDKTPIQSGRQNDKYGYYSIDFDNPFISFRNLDDDDTTAIFGYTDTQYYFQWCYTCPVDGIYFTTETIKGIDNSTCKISTFSSHRSAGSKVYVSYDNSYYGFKCKLSPYQTKTLKLNTFAVKCVPDKAPITKNTNITINNNTWNGNIYTDNSTNLTYIYPQYTTINENNETVTNISNNPIIYNQETKQYYTYDQTTNNYYYITYNAPTPTPTPTPDPTPTPSPDVPAKPIVPETQNLIVPKMNANSFTDEHGTWVASGSSKYSDVFDFFHAFDRSTSDFWETNASPSYLQIEIPDPESYYIDGYIMRISKFNNRYSKDWTLQGSDDGETWDDLDKQTSQNLSDMEEHKYSLTLRKAYKYYRLNMSNYASSMCSLSHFNLLGYDAKDVTFPTPDPDKPTPSPSPSPGGPGGGDTPSGGGSNWWDKLLDDILFGLLEGIKGILKLLFDLFSSILGWIIWLCSKVFDLFPFLPPGAGALLVGGVVICFILAFIKFIRG